jgi:hypothetical protein
MVSLAVLVAVAVFLALGGGAQRAVSGGTDSQRVGQPLSSVALMSHFAQVANLGFVDPAALEVHAQQGRAKSAEGQVNQDWNARPQNETTITVNPADPTKFVAGANDYGIGPPIPGVYNSEQVNYFPPMPTLAATKDEEGEQIEFTQLPDVAGDPAVAYSNVGNRVYMIALATSVSFCENGIFLYRSTDNGATWTRPTVPPLRPPSGLRTVAYWPMAHNCSVFHDKPYVTVDNTGGPHNGRIYVTWSRFLTDKSGGTYKESPIVLAYSDDFGDTFSTPIEVSGFSATLCPNQTEGKAGQCDEDQGSVPVVLPNGKVAVAFINDQGVGFDQGFRDQYLVTVFDPTTGTVAGPYHVADMKDGLNDYPVNSDGSPTLCNSNFRQWGVGNLAVGGTTLYVTYSDDAKHAGEFPYPTPVDPSPPYACPDGKETDADVYVWKSTDGGVTWSEFTNAGLTKASKGAHDQWFPWVAADAAGRVSVLFFDRRYDPGNKLADATLVSSATNGLKWKAKKVSKFSSNFDDAFLGRGSFIGDYNGNTIDSAGNSRPLWTGVVPGKQDSDVFTATVAP